METGPLLLDFTVKLGFVKTSYNDTEENKLVLYMVFSNSNETCK